MSRWLAVALVWLAYVLPGERVVDMLAESRAAHTPLHIEATLSARDSSAPKNLVIELHPELGARISDDRGGRWVVSGGRASAGTKLPAPAWLPDLAPLVMRRESELRSWMSGEGIDFAHNELARCGAGDCWVLGEQAATQLWIQKPALELRRVTRGKTTLEAYDDWQSFGKIRFPKRIEIDDDSGAIATLTVDRVTAAAQNSFSLAPGDR